jgi:hypothetical protein
MRGSKPLGILTVLVVIALVSGCTRDVSRTFMESRFRNRTAAITKTLTVTGDMTEISLQVRGNLRRGDFSLQIFGPDGVLLWEESPSFRYNFRTTFPPEPGEWQMVLDLENAYGTYEVRWEGR